MSKSLHGMTPLCNNTIHEIYINLSDNDGHSANDSEAIRGFHEHTIGNSGIIATFLFPYLQFCTI